MMALNLEHVHGVTMILIHSYCKCKDIAMHPSCSDACLFYSLSSATLVTNLMIGHERGKKDGIVTTKFRTYPWPCDIFVAFTHVVNISFSKKWFH